MEKHVNIPIPSENIEGRLLPIYQGQVLFILGANGAGKSSLIYHVLKNLGDYNNIVLISAHRQIWFDTSVIDMSNSEFASTLEYLQSNVRYSNTSRWKVDDARQSKLPVIRLKKAINRRNRDVADKVDARDIDGALKVSVSPKEIINSVLISSGMPITIEHDDEDNITAVNSKYNPPAIYSISQLSDGEKNAITISADVISALPGTLFIIDEPERHLHRSVSSPLLSELIAIRPDCFFIVSTHDIGLASDMDNSQILLVKSCKYTSEIATSWETELIRDPGSIPDHIKKDIIGAKEKVIFIEGINSSLDIGLYKSVFPDVSLIPKEGCEDVAISVRGIRGNDKLGWVNAFGLVDNDNKKAEEIDSLKSDFIFTLKYHSIESIFYHPVMIEFFIKKYGDIFEIDDSVMNDIKKDILTVLIDSSKKKDLCSLAVNKSVRWMFNQLIPSHRAGFENKTVSINAGDIYNNELSIYEDALERKDVSFLIERYSIRRTGMIDKIIRRLNCPNRAFYETKIMTLVRDNQEAKRFVIECLDGLTESVYS
ncbi:AAA family ATPase [Enterobacter sp. SA187]|uniref:AAA family ATPase n=1 Tax=Enterobacter sp. SA187 TaxID=1914861 RepID=UPI0009FAF921|nr:AAA family ATPase [Enterobacter sp. SA187]